MTTAPGRASAAAPDAQSPTSHAYSRIGICRAATAIITPAPASAVSTAAVSQGALSAAPAPNRPTTPAAATCTIATRRVRAARPAPPIPTAARTSGQGASDQRRPSEAGTARAVSATPTTAPSCRTLRGSASAAAKVASSAPNASSQPAEVASAIRCAYPAVSACQIGRAACSGASAARSTSRVSTTPMTIRAPAEAICGPARTSWGSRVTTAPITATVAAASTRVQDDDTTSAIRAVAPITARLSTPPAMLRASTFCSSSAAAVTASAASTRIRPERSASGTTRACSSATAE